MHTDTATIAPTAAKPARKAKHPPLQLNRTCCECGTEFVTSHRGKEFCCEAHRVAFANRCAARGKVLIPLAMGWRNKRGGKGIGATAMQEMVRLLDRFAAEDREAGRQNVAHYADRLINHSINLRWSDR